MALPADRPALIAAAALVIVALLYSVLVMRAPLAWVSAVVPLAFLYLVWRFIRAHERIAAAVEAGATTEVGSNE